MLSGRVLSTAYKRSPMPEGGLEIPLLITIIHEDCVILDNMNNFVTNNYIEVMEVEGQRRRRM